ncbi:MAG TPA: DnaJ domain-containing protein [Bacteroidia bacterium]|nr:DnaJ domain-containing protein [Bacteroidia bacterium]
MINQDCYRLLNVSPDADEKTIRKAYRSRSRELHPDVNPSPDAATQFAELAQALAVLIDPIERLKHDDRFGYNKKARNQTENAKQRFSDFQKEKASSLVNEWSNDYGKAMDMRQQQRLALVAKHKKRMQIVIAVAVVSLVVSLLLGILFISGVL